MQPGSLKGKRACCGTVKGNSIKLQGNHRDHVEDLLSLSGFSMENYFLTIVILAGSCYV